jgi:hypothetical protein
LTVHVKNLRPQSLRTRTAAIPHVKGNHLRGLGIQAIQSHRLFAFFCTKLAIASASTSRRRIMTLPSQVTDWTWR